MRTLLVSLLFVASAGILANSQSLRHIDFRNFEYPWNGPPGWSDHLEWLNVSEPNRVQLVDGRWQFTSDSDSDGKGSAQALFSGLTLESVQFGDVTGDALDEAIVVLRFDTGGTQYAHYIYIYSSEAGNPKLKGYFHSGDRAASGLYKVYPKAGKLVVELFDPEKRSGDCCSSGFVRTRYRWHNRTFERVGPDEFRTAKAVSRVPVSIFGNHK